MRSRYWPFCPSRADRRSSNSLFSLSITWATSGSLLRASISSGNLMAGLPSRSLSRRALRPVSSSSLTTTPPALTRSPSCTLSSPTMPPVRCWTFLMLESTTTEPPAMTAPANCAVEAHPPTPPASSATPATPAARCRRIEAREDWGSFCIDLTSRIRHHLQRPHRRHRRLLTDHLGRDLILRPEGLRPPLVHHQEMIDRRERARPVRDYDNDAASAAHPENRLGERFLAGGVQIGARLIEHDQEWIAVERPRPRHALALAGRKRGALLADRGVVTVRQIEDELVHAGGLRRRDDRPGVRFGLEPRNVLGDRPGDQLHVLRQVAHMAAL